MISPFLISSNTHTENLCLVRDGFYYSQECYFASKKFLSFRINIAVCLHYVNFLYVSLLSISDYK